MARLMVFAAYPDEIALSAGGLMANHAQAGDEVFAVTMVFPGMPFDRTPDHPLGKYETEEVYGPVVLEELEKAKNILGITEMIPVHGKQADADMLFDDDVLSKTHELIEEYEPDIVVAHWPVGDYTDLVAVGVNVLRVVFKRKLKKRPLVYFSETLTGTHTMHFSPCIYIDISENIKKKEEAVACFWQGHARPFFDNRAKPVAHFRGLECGVECAEAYAPLYGTFGKEFLPGSLLDPKSELVRMNWANQLLPVGGRRERTAWKDGRYEVLPEQDD